VFKQTVFNNTSCVVTDLAEHFASGRVEDSMLFHKKIPNVNFFVKKIKKVPCCRRRIGLPSHETSGLHVNRVSRVNNTSYEVTDLAEHFASGRAEDSILFHKTFAFCANVL
jgi:hypothetical protein